MLLFAIDSLALLLKSIVFAFDVDVIGVVTVTVAIDSVADSADDGIDTLLVQLIAVTILLLPADILVFVFFFRVFTLTQLLQPQNPKQCDRYSIQIRLIALAKCL